ncbi:MAG: nitroreductase family deazaflavin-dependent oxidoreductase [Deltaproteobacteria bacterium]|nr:nitroreductase family deazaflavin-dependent oxidoreductase [Deltaproteobacteria bacterium]MBI3388790.1 nitroreductase family deazaflavin-dependent oxidoreductase [Deltaproteobacteria bacterium]
MSEQANPRVRPFAERLHFIPRLIVRHPQALLVRLFRNYIERAPGWVLLTTKGRKTGLPREVLLPCERFDNRVLVISTYGWRSNWMRNIQSHPEVRITCEGQTMDGRADIIEAVLVRQELVSAHPFFVPFPTHLLNAIHRTILRPLWVPFLRWWVRRRPVVVIHVRQ